MAADIAASLETAREMLAARRDAERERKRRNKAAFEAWMKDGSDKTQVENVTAILNRAAEAEQKVAALEARLLQAEKQRKEDLLDAAIADGRIAASEKSKYDGLNYGQISAFLKDLKPAIKPTQLVERIFKANDRHEWTFEEWARKDPDGLSAMEKENPDRFTA